MMAGILSKGELWTILLASTSHAVATNCVRWQTGEHQGQFTSSTILSVVRRVAVGRNYEVTTSTKEAVG